MSSLLKYKTLLLLLFLLNTHNVSSQNSYGWERILNTIYGINGFYIQQNSQTEKVWMIRTAAELIGTGNYDFIRYNNNTNTWRAASNSIFRGVYYSYYIGGGHSNSGYALPPAFYISPGDTNFILINTVVPHDQNPPYDIRLFYSYDNGITRTDIPYFQSKSFTGIAISPKNDSVNFAAAGDTIFKSTDRGVYWTPVSVIPFLRGTLRINPFDTSIVYALDDSLFVSSDGGNSFNYILNKKFTNFTFKYSDSTILATWKNKLYRSSDSGFSWNIIDSLSDSINVLDNDPENENIVYAGTNTGLYRSTDGGSDFYLFNNSFSPSKKITGLCKEAGRNFIYAATEEAVYKCWNSYVIGISNLSNQIPGSFSLFQNYPNPFNPLTTIKYQLTSSSNIKIKVTGILGHELITLVDQRQNAGTYEVDFNADGYPSGVYFYILEADGKIMDTKKLIILK